MPYPYTAFPANNKEGTTKHIELHDDEQAALNDLRTFLGTGATIQESALPAHLAQSDLDTRYINVNGDAMAAALSMGGFKITNVGAPTVATDVARKSESDAALTAANNAQTTANAAQTDADQALIDAAAAHNEAVAAQATADAALPKAGGAMAGAIDMQANSLTGLPAPTVNSDAVRKIDLDDVNATAVNAENVAVAALPKAGGTMAGIIAMGGSKITDVGVPTAATDVARKSESDAALSAANTAQTDATQALSDAAAAQTTADAALPKAGGTMAGTLNLGANILHNAKLYQVYDRTRLAGLLGATPTFDFSFYSIHTGTIDQNITGMTLTWPTMTTDQTYTVELGLWLGSTAFTVAWPVEIKWLGGETPILELSRMHQFMLQRIHVDGAWRVWGTFVGTRVA